MTVDLEKLKLSPLSDMTITWETIGINQYPLLIVDNFYDNPNYIFHLAQSLHYKNPKGKHIHASTTVSLSTHELHQFIDNIYAKVWHIKRGQLLGLNHKWRFFRSVPSGSSLPTRREDPHADGMFFIAGLVYLTPDQYCKGGTGFFRHRKTGAEEKPPSLEWLRGAMVPPAIIQKLNQAHVYRAYQASSLKNYDDFIKLIPFKTTGNQYHLATNNDEWALTKLVQMKFNRFIMYPAFALHKAIYEEDWFDGDIQQRRLTQNLFFKYPTIKHFLSKINN